MVTMQDGTHCRSSWMATKGEFAVTVRMLRSDMQAMEARHTSPLQLVENVVVMLLGNIKDTDANGGRDLFTVRYLMGVWTSATIGASKSLHSSRWKTTFTTCCCGPRS